MSSRQKPPLVCDQLPGVTLISEPAKTDLVVEQPVQELIAEDPAAIFRRVEAKVARGASGDASGEHEHGMAGESVTGHSGLELTLVPEGLRSGRPLKNNELPGVTSSPRPYILFGVALSLVVLIFLGYFLQKSSNDQPAGNGPSLGKLSDVPSGNSDSSMSVSRKSRASSDPGFILQVAAMKSEKSSVSLADLLRQKGFPAYVFQPAAEHFYRVLVGPFGDADSAVKVEEKLREQGFQAIRRKNTPAQ